MSWFHEATRKKVPWLEMKYFKLHEMFAVPITL